MRSIAVILVSLLSFAPLYSLALPTFHNNVAVAYDGHVQQYHAGGATNMKNCNPALHEKRYARSGIHCAQLGGIGFQPAKTKGRGHGIHRICMTNEQFKGSKSPGICWMPNHSHSGASKPASLTSNEGHVHSKVDMVKKVRRSYVVPGRVPVDRPISPPAPIRPLPPIPGQASAVDAQPVAQPRPLPLIPGQAPAVNAQPVARPRPLPLIPGQAPSFNPQLVAQPRVPPIAGSRIRGPRPNLKPGRH